MKGPKYFLPLILLTLVVGSTAFGLSDAVTRLDIWLVLPLALVGLALGWILGILRLPEVVNLLIGLFIGGQILFIRVGSLLDEFLQIPLSQLRMVGEAVGWVWMELTTDQPGVIPDWSLGVTATNNFWAGVVTLLERVQMWVLGIVNGKPMFDPVAVSLVWGAAIWCCAVWAGATFRRRQWTLGAVLPAGILLAATFSYVRTTSMMLLPMMGGTMLLMALGGHDLRERGWLANGIDFSRDIRLDLWVAAVLVTIGLLSAAAVLPMVSVQQIADWVQEITKDQSEDTQAIAESLGLEQLPEPATGPMDKARSGGLPQRHLIGSGPELSREVVMLVRTGDVLEPIPGGGVAAPSKRYYWRSMTFDAYTGYGWTSTRFEVNRYSAGDLLINEPLPGQRWVRQDVQLVGDSPGLLYAAGALVTADKDFNVDWRLPQDPFGVLIDESRYRADSLVSVATADQLRAAGTDYPLPIVNYYVKLPETVPDRVFALARDLTATSPTPYDRAVAIERYLRTTYPYTLAVSYPPVNRDVADYFLFDLKKGYCDYYATAMVVLARAAGVPARLVIGYASGTYDMYNARYVVTEADAHAWVEVYFPTYGWVEFEPTGNQPEVDRAQLSEIEEEAYEALMEPLVPEEPEPTTAGWFGWSWLLSGLIVAVVGLGGSTLVEVWWLSRRAPVESLGAIYRQLRYHARRLGTDQQGGETPTEFGDAFAARLIKIGPEVYWPDRLFPAEWEVRQLMALYVKASYAPEPPTVAEMKGAIRLWLRLRLRLWMARWRRKPQPERLAGTNRNATVPGSDFPRFQ